MISKRLRLKFMLLLVLAVSAVGLNVATPASAVCGVCGVIRDSSGRVVGYGCVSGGSQNCTATVSGCSYFGGC